ncbi:hypothetical protein GCM10009430_29810 [Aquimarina litoralis]|uniref:DUF4249 family protein n=2 Tax=Aquimarina litoralis TaxID=584605 RepID=A0ABN1IZZ4_9FLAO
MTNCEDNEKFPLAEQQNGAFVLVDIENPVIDVTAIETSTYGGTLRATSDLVASHEFMVRRVSGGTASEFVSIFMTDTFPADFQIGAPEIATALGLDITDILPGDRFDFTGKTTSTDGTIVLQENLQPDLLVEIGQRQAYSLQTFVSCPFVLEEALGTYELLDCGLTFCNGGNTFEIVAGEDPNTVIMQNPYNSFDPDTGEPFNIVMQVNPTSGEIIIEDQPAFDTADTGNNGFNPTSIETESGFFFSCVGVITTTVDTSIERISDGARFTFGARAFEAQKL